MDRMDGGHGAILVLVNAWQRGAIGLPFPRDECAGMPEGAESLIRGFWQRGVDERRAQTDLARNIIIRRNI